MEEIRNVYYDINKGGYNVDNTYEYLNKKYSKNFIKNTIKNFDIKEIKDKKINKDNFIKINAEPQSWQMDITFFNQYAKYNKGYTAILTIININSRYAYGYPIKTKSVNEIYTNIQKFLEEEQKVKNIYTDNGKEFNNNKLKQLYKDKNINYFFFNKSEAHQNNLAIVEAFNKRIRNLIDNYMITYNTYKYVDILENLIDNYNNTVHSSIKKEPVNFTNYDEQKHYEKIAKHNLEVKNKIFGEFKVGDQVRILITKNLFDKGMKNYYSKDIYTIENQLYNSYDVKDKNGNIKNVSAYMMKKVNNITNPYNNKTEKTIESNKTKFKNQKSKAKIQKALDEEGINKNNIIRTKTRSQKRIGK